MNKSISLFGVVHLPSMDEMALQVLRSGKIASGDFVNQFENCFAELIGEKNVVATYDMTSAMFLALHLSGVGPGDEVITTPFSCLATTSAIAHLGAKPVWVDVENRSINMSLVDLNKKITSKTKAIILYHTAGYPGPSKDVLEVCNRTGIQLIEDCNNALLATIEDRFVGSFGNFSVYSFYPNRQINCTEGGALVCKNSEDAVAARKLRRFGINPVDFRLPDGEINPESNVPKIGWAITMNNLCAAIGLPQISSVISRVEKTQANAMLLKKMISTINGINVIEAVKNSSPAYWALLIFLENRDFVLKNLQDRGVHASKIHMRNDIYTGLIAATESCELPNTDYLQDHIIALPCGWWLDERDIVSIADVLQESMH